MSHDMANKYCNTKIKKATKWGEHFVAFLLATESHSVTFLLITYSLITGRLFPRVPNMGVFL